ncbi:MAG: hypothetical protein ABJE95_09360 [Byssovorax sp.]
MLAFPSNHSSPRVRATLALFVIALGVAAVAGGGGCTLLVGGQLSDKPSEGAGGEGGGGAGSTASQSSAAHGSSGTGSLVCKQDMANCNGLLSDGCETHLLDDPKNCGACKKACLKDEHCKDGKCE